MQISEKSNLTIAEPSAKWQFWVLLAFAALIRFFDLGWKQLWLDEIIQAIHSSRKLSLAQVLQGVTQDRGATPLDYIIQHFTSMWLGQSEFVLRLHAAIFGTATVAAIYFLFRKLLIANTDEKASGLPAKEPSGRPELQRTALIAAGLYAVYPLHQHYSQEGRPYALFVLLTVCSYLALVRLLERGSVANWILYSFVNTLLLYSQYFGAFVLFSQLIASLTMFWRTAPGLKPRKVIDADFAGLKAGPPTRIDRTFVILQFCSIAISFLLLLPWIILGIATISGYKPQPVHFGFKLFLSFVQGLGDGSHPLAWILLIFAALGITKLWRGKRYALFSLLLCWCVLPVPLIFLVLWLKDYFFAIRHFLFITPALLALVALGIEYLAQMLHKKVSPQRTTKASIVLIAAVSLLVIGLHVPDRREDLRGAGQFLTQNVRTDDVVIAPEVDSVLSFYFPQIMAHSRPASMLTDAAAIERARRIFIVKTEYSSGADQQIIDSTVKEFPSVRRIPLRDVEILQIPGI